MRYLPQTPENRTAMLQRIGVAGIDELFDDVPGSVMNADVGDLPDHMSEIAVERHFSGLARESMSPSSVPSFLGAGAYRHHVPATVQLHDRQHAPRAWQRRSMPWGSGGSPLRLVRACVMRGMHVGSDAARRRGRRGEAPLAPCKRA